MHFINDDSIQKKNCWQLWNVMHSILSSYIFHLLLSTTIDFWLQCYIIYNFLRMIYIYTFSNQDDGSQNRMTNIEEMGMGMISDRITHFFLLPCGDFETSAVGIICSPGRIHAIGPSLLRLRSVPDKIDSPPHGIV